MTEQFSGAHSERGGDPGDLYPELGGIVREDSDGESEGEALVIVEGARTEPELDGASGGCRGQLRAALTVETVDLSLSEALLLFNEEVKTPQILALFYSVILKG
jgi:hypothetical protein